MDQAYSSILLELVDKAETDRMDLDPPPPPPSNKNKMPPRIGTGPGAKRGPAKKNTLALPWKETPPVSGTRARHTTSFAAPSDVDCKSPDTQASTPGNRTLSKVLVPRTKGSTVGPLDGQVHVAAVSGSTTSIKPTDSNPVTPKVKVPLLAENSRSSTRPVRSTRGNRVFYNIDPFKNLRVDSNNSKDAAQSSPTMLGRSKRAHATLEGPVASPTTPLSASNSATPETPGTGDPPPKKKRGRPRKHPLPVKVEPPDVAPVETVGKTETADSGVEWTLSVNGAQ